MNTTYIDNLDIKNFDFLNSLKKLKKCTIKNIKVDNLNYLKNLRSFVLNQKAEDESNISSITELKKIEESQYPVSNMELYKFSKYLRTVGVDAKNIYNIEI